MMRAAAGWTYPGEDADLAAKANLEASDGFRPRAPIDEMSAKLKALLGKHGRLTRAILDAEEGMPNAQALVDRFGGLDRVYALAGYNPDKHQLAMLAARKAMRS